VLYYNEARGIFVTIMGVVMILIGYFFLFGTPLTLSGIMVFILGGLLLVLLPSIRAKILAERSFVSNKMLQEELILEFMGDKIKTNGSTFNFEMTWISLPKVMELNGWFLLYHSKQSFLT